MLSTVIGSYPVYSDKNKTTKNKLLNILGIYDKCKIAIQHAVESQIKAGIDIISDGQVRGDMIEIFTKHIPGCKYKGNTCEISSKLTALSYSISANDLKLATKFLNNYLIGSDLSSKDKKKKGVKGIITGPCTLVQSCKLGNIYKDKNSAIIDMAKVLKTEAYYLEKAGAKIIQIDEPFLSTGLIDMDIAKEAISIISREVGTSLAIHSCGGIKNIFGDLLTFDVDIIDCEFAGHPGNLQVLDSYSDEIGSKKIGLGVINTKTSSVDSIEEISRIINKGIEIVGEDNLLIDPDCGMKPLNDNIAFLKLKNMVKAMKGF